MTSTRNFAFDCVGALNKSRSVDDVLGVVWRAGGFFGFDNFGISGIPMPGEKIDPYIILHGWPEEWGKRYVANDYVHDDPVVQKLKVSTMPFQWDELDCQSMSVGGRRVIAEAQDFGLVAGFAVPILTTHGFQAIVSFSARKLDLPEDRAAALHLIAIYAHQFARRFVPGSQSADSENECALTSREIECLKWSSLGKSAWEVSVILGLSKRTVEFYIGNAIEKLGATNRVQAVAQAIRAGFIQ